MKNFRDLYVWHKSHALTLECYKLTRDFPKHELYGITSQMRRCAASIAANIAERLRKAEQWRLSMILRHCGWISK